MGAEKETEHFFSSSEGLYESAHAGILAGLNCFQRLSAVDTCTFDCGHKLGAEKRKI